MTRGADRLFRDLLVKFFEAVSRNVYARSVRVEVVPGDRPPYLGTVAWDNTRWRIFVTSAHRSSYDMLRTCFHELAHVLHGDVSMGSKRGLFDDIRAEMSGRSPPSVRTRSGADADADKVRELGERAAEAFAEQALVRHWPELEGVLDRTIANAKRASRS